jgi:hypothetical protein
VKVRKKIRLNVRPIVKPRVIRISFAEWKLAERLGISIEDYARSLMEKRKWTHLTDEEFDQVLKEFGNDPRAMAIELEIRIMEKNT